MGVIEGGSNELLTASSLNQPDTSGRVRVRCLNPGLETLQLKAGTKVGVFTPTEEMEVKPTILPTAGEPLGRGKEVPAYVQELYQAADAACEEGGAGSLQKLLCKYESVFSTGDEDVGRTSLVEHQIPLEEGTRPIRRRKLRPQGK